MKVFPVLVQSKDGTLVATATGQRLHDAGLAGMQVLHMIESKALDFVRTNPDIQPPVTVQVALTASTVAYSQ